MRRQSQGPQKHLFQTKQLIKFSSKAIYPIINFSSHIDFFPHLIGFSPLNLDIDFSFYVFICQNFLLFFS